MRTLLLITFLGIYFSINAQINLEHTFLNYNSYYGEIYIEQNIDKFFILKNENIEMYNSDFSLYKTVNISAPYGYRAWLLDHCSKKVFNLDENYEFTCAFIDTLNNSGYKLIVFDDNGNIIKELGNSYYGYIVKFNNSLKFIVSISNGINYDYTFEIFSLPGFPQEECNNLKNIRGVNSMPAYPNPSSSYITIPYILNNSKIVALNIFNDKGILIESKKITNKFNKININTNKYKPGLYFYKYNNITEQFIVY